jgi:hypothetical protein
MLFFHNALSRFAYRQVSSNWFLHAKHSRSVDWKLLQSWLNKSLETLSANGLTIKLNDRYIDFMPLVEFQKSLYRSAMCVISTSLWKLNPLYLLLQLIVL